MPTHAAIPIPMYTIYFAPMAISYLSHARRWVVRYLTLCRLAVGTERKGTCGLVRSGRRTEVFWVKVRRQGEFAEGRRRVRRRTRSRARILPGERRGLRVGESRRSLYFFSGPVPGCWGGGL